MSVLIDENGKILTKESIANQLLTPVQFGKFIISDAATKFIESELNIAFQFFLTRQERMIVPQTLVKS